MNQGKRHKWKEEETETGVFEAYEEMIENSWLVFFSCLFCVLLVSLWAPSFFPPLLFCIAFVSGSYLLYLRFLVPSLIIFVQTPFRTTASFLLSALLDTSPQASELIKEDSIEPLATLFSSLAALDYRSKAMKYTTKILLVVLKKNDVFRNRVVQHGTGKILLDMLSISSIADYTEDKLVSDSKEFLVTVEYAACCMLELLKNNIINPNGLRIYLDEKSNSEEVDTAKCLVSARNRFEALLRNLIFLIQFGSVWGKEIAILFITILLYDEYMKPIILASDISSVLIAAMSEDCEESTRYSAILAMSVLVYDKTTTRVHLIDKGLLPSLVKALSSLNTKTRRHAALCIQLLTSQTSLVPHLVCSGIVSELTTLLSSFTKLIGRSLPGTVECNDGCKIVEYTLLSLFNLFSESENAKNEGSNFGIGRTLIEIIGDTDTINTRILENAIRALGAFAKRKKMCDYSLELIFGGACQALCRCLTSSEYTLRLYSLLALDVLLQNKIDDILDPMGDRLSGIEFKRKMKKSIEDIRVDTQFEVERKAANELLRKLG